jgi:integrase
MTDFVVENPRTGRSKRVRRRLPSAANRQEAQKIEDVMRRKIEEALAPPPTAVVATFAAFAERWLKDGQPDWSPNTYRVYEQVVRVHLIPWLGRMGLAAITAGDIQKYKAENLTGGPNRKALSTKTIVNHLGVLSAMFQDAVDWELLSRNPVLKVKRPRPEPESDKPKAWTLDEARRFMEYVQREEPSWLPLFLFTAGVGLRTGEAAAITWADVGLEEMVVHVRKSLSHGNLTVPKGKRARHEPIPAELRSLMLTHKASASGERVFLARDGRALTTDRIKSTFHRCIRDSGVPRITFHGLRHTFCTLVALHTGAPQRVVQRLAGHADIRTTERYTHVTDPAMREAMDRFPSLLPPAVPPPATTAAP